jgi:hypothetical protein
VDQSSAYSVKLAACFNWNRAKYRRACIGTADLFYLLSEVSMERDACGKLKANADRTC